MGIDFGAQGGHFGDQNDDFLSPWDHLGPFRESLGSPGLPKSGKRGKTWFVAHPKGAQREAKRVQKVTKMRSKGVPIELQNGAKCVPEGGKRDANNWFYKKVPLGSVLGPSWAPF